MSNVEATSQEHEEGDLAAATSTGLRNSRAVSSASVRSFDPSPAHHGSVDVYEVLVDLFYAEKRQFLSHPSTDSSRKTPSWRSRTPLSRSPSSRSTSSSLFLDRHLDYSKSTMFTATNHIRCKYKNLNDETVHITTAFGMDFKNVHGIASSPWTTDMYLVDSGNDRIVVLDQYGRAKLSFGGHGSGRSQFNNPHGIAISDRDEIIVADYWNDRVHSFDITGHLKRTFGAEILRNPVSVACIDGLIFVCDAENIQSFRFNGQPVKRYLSNILNPAAITRGPNNTFVVLDAVFHKIHKFNINGQPRDCFNLSQRGWGSSYNYTPGMTVDTEGFILVTRPAEEQIDVFTPVGNSLCCSLRDKNLGPVFDVAVLNDGRVAVACESKVVIFGKVKDATFNDDATFRNDRRASVQRDPTNRTSPARSPRSSTIPERSRSRSIRNNCLCC